MQLFNAMGLVAAAAIPVVILLYLLKQDFEEVSVSSTYLWQKALVETEASRPWQKLRNNLLMLLQLLTLAVLAFALARPFLTRSGLGHENIVILDVSLSMQATDADENRLAAAKRRVREQIDGMMPGDRMTLIAAGHDARMLLSRSEDKSTLHKTLDDLMPQNGSAALDDAIAIAASMHREIEGTAVIVFTDHDRPDMEDFQLVNLSQNGDNAAIWNVSYAEDPATETITVLARIRAFGAARDVTIECEADGAVIDVRTVPLPQDETANIYFKDIPPDVRRIVVRIMEVDDLAADNAGYLWIPPKGSARVLLVTERNLFLEKALSLRSDVEVHKSTVADALTLRGYDLYVFDGVVLPEWPDDGAIWLINPPAADSGTSAFGYAVTDSDAGSNAAITPVRGTLGDSLFAYVDLDALRVAKAVGFDAPEATPALMPIATRGDASLMLAGERATEAGGVQRVLLTGFDFHDSNWPVSKDFPIFVQNVLQWTVPQTTDATNGIRAGEVVTIAARATARRIDITPPGGEPLTIAPPFPIRAVAETDALGFYAITQTDGSDGVWISEFAANPPVETESDLRSASTSSEAAQRSVKRNSRQDITYILIAVALAIMMLEWWVYRRGY